MAERGTLLRTINATRVTKRDLIRVLKECERRHKSKDWEAGDGMFITVRLFHKQQRKCQAICFRFDALSELLHERALPGFYTLDIKDGNGILLRDAVLEAAATEPLISVHEQVVFERASFVRRCLQLSKPQGGKIQ